LIGVLGFWGFGVLGFWGFGMQSSQDLVLDAEMSKQAELKASTELENSLVNISVDYNNFDNKMIQDGVYTISSNIDQGTVTLCGKNISSTASWTGSGNRDLQFKLSTRVLDSQMALGLSHCATNPPIGSWAAPATNNCASLSSGKPTALDVLNGVVYLSADTAPFLYINDTKGANLNPSCQAQSSPTFISFANAFDAGIKINDLKVVRLQDKVYVFAARNTTPGELQIIDVTDIKNPVLVKNIVLKNVSGALSQAFKLFYFDKKVYVTVREGSVKELHIFDVENPGAAFEIGAGTQLNTTVESLVVAKILGKTVLFMAADSNIREILVYDVSNSSSPTEIVAARQNLPGSQDGACIFYLNGYLYFGRESVAGGGAEFYIYDVRNPWAGLLLKQSTDIGSSVISIAVAGNYSFLSTAKVGSEFQVWSSNPQNPIVKINNSNFSFPNLIYGGLVFEGPLLYVASASSVSFKMIHSP
jgi:hypothetical protein